MSSTPQLLVVMPVFNEQASIEKVIRDWFAELDERVGDFRLLAIDDGSVDATLEKLRMLSDELGSRLEIRSRPNRGHGQTCLEGYRIAAEQGVPHILQIDSDGQCDPAFFEAFWEIREPYDVIYGKRRREDGLRRIAASIVLRWLLRMTQGVNCADPNVPYRLMRTAVCAPIAARIPEHFFLANVALAVLLRRTGNIRHGEVPIRFRERSGGEPSVPLSRFASRAIELVLQLRQLLRENPVAGNESKKPCTDPLS